MDEDVYSRLRRFLDRLPSGFPETPDGVEIRLLKKMFSPEDAELVMKLTDRPETVSDISKRTGIDEGELPEKLEALAVRGLIFRICREGRRLYQAYHFVIGLYEFQVNRLDRELCELFEAYLPYIGLSSARLTSQYRVIPVESSLQDNAQVAPYNRIREIVRKETVISLAPCICKKEQELLGHKCEKPREVCLMFGDFARFYIDNGYGRSIGADEALRVLDRAEESGLVLTCSNARKLETLCCCCTCCCPTLRNIRKLKSPAHYMLSYYQAAVDRDACTDCGACADGCPMEAIAEDGDVRQVLEKRCIGCGLCVNRCPVGAISLRALPDRREGPPPTREAVLDIIAEERGIGRAPAP